LNLFEQLVKEYVAARNQKFNYDDYCDLQLRYYKEELGPLFEKYYKNVRLGVSLGPGWMPIYVEAAGMMERIATSTGLEFSVDQVKQKLGGLRIYAWPISRDDMAYSALRNVIDTAANIAAKTCEYCGKPGRLGGNGYIRVACEEHDDTH
jgi:hypothetical protein